MQALESDEKTALVWKAFVHRSITKRRLRHMVEQQSDANLREMQVTELEMAVEAANAPGYNQAAAPESPTKGLFGCVPGCK